MEGLEGTVKLIAEYGILVVIAAVFLIMMVKMFNKQQTWLEKFVGGSINITPTREEISALEIVNEKIYQEVRGVLNSLNSDRTYVYMYHNGGTSSSGLHFQKMSCICEVVSQGILPVANEKQNLYRASYALLCESLKNKGYLVVKNSDDLKGKDDFMYNEMVSRHAESAYFRSMKDSHNNVIGFLGVDYCSKNNDVGFTEADKILRQVSLKISSLVDLRDEVKGDKNVSQNSK